MAPPILEAAAYEPFEKATALWARLLVEVVYNPSADPTCKKEAKETYERDWKPFFDKWTDENGPPVDVSPLNGLIGQTNGLAKSCLKNFDPTFDQVKGHDVEASHNILTDISEAAPGGARPRDGGVLGLGIKPASLFLGGAALVAGGLGIRYIAGIFTPVRGVKK